MTGTCRIPNKVAFVEGVRNGETYDESDIDELVTNFGKYRGYWNPYVALGHARLPQYAAYAGLSFGDVVAARKVRVVFNPRTGHWEPTARTGPGTRAALAVDLENVPKEFGELVASRRLPRRSIEMFDHTHPLMRPDDRPELTNVLKCVSFLGDHPECVKGMPPAVVEFADLPAHGRRLPDHPPRFTAPAKCFGDPPMDGQTPPPDATPMPREQILDALAKAGAPTDLITEAVPDALLQWVVSLLPPAPTPDAVAPDAVKAFGDKAPAVLSLLDAVVRKATAPFAPAIAHARRAAADATAAKIRAFGDRMTGVGGKVAFMTPVQFEAVKPLLEKLDDATVKTFSDKKATGTALDEQIASLTATFATPVKTFGDRAADPLKTAGGGMTPERRAELLKQTPEGRAVLAREKK